MEGNLAQFPVTELLRDLYARRVSGVVSFSNRTTTKRVYFKRGAVVFASSSAFEERLGERLVRAGKLKRTDLELACRVREISRLRLGTTLVDMGYLTPAELDDRVREQVEHIIRSVLPWEAGQFQKELKANPVDPDLERRDISILNLLLESLRGLDGAEVTRRGLGDLDRPLRYAADPTALDPSLKLTPEEGFLLSRVDGSASAAEIARLSPLGDEETLRRLWALVAAGLLEVERTASADEAPYPNAPPAEDFPAPPTPSAEALRFRDEMFDKHRRAEAMTLYELLEVRPGARAEDVKAAYFRLAKRLHPDHRAGMKLDDAEGVFDDLYLRMKNAYETLSNDATRRRYDFSLERRSQTPGSEQVETTGGGKKREPMVPEPSFSSEQAARMHYANGERYFNGGQYHEAIEELRAALRYDGTKGPYHRLLARALAKNPKWRKQAEQHYRTALDRNRFDGQSYFELGELYESLGLATRARKMFEEAVALDPDNFRAFEKLHAGRSGSSQLGKLREGLHPDRES